MSQIPVDARRGVPRKYYTYEPGEPRTARFGAGNLMEWAEGDVSQELFSAPLSRVLESWRAAPDRDDPRWAWPVGNAIIRAHPEFEWLIVNAAHPEIALGRTSLHVLFALTRTVDEPDFLHHSIERLRDDSRPAAAR